mmetsp:Transcript_22702/g.44795  ORF Transcript_22702/g.44795 Transcript_22702/m.44795 type:complete len:262 (+) Transcript_22702:217-1002(+)
MRNLLWALASLLGAALSSSPALAGLSAVAPQRRRLSGKKVQQESGHSRPTYLSFAAVASFLKRKIIGDPSECTCECCATVVRWGNHKDGKHKYMCGVAFGGPAQCGVGAPEDELPQCTLPTDDKVLTWATAEDVVDLGRWCRYECRPIANEGSGVEGNETVASTCTRLSSAEQDKAQTNDGNAEDVQADPLLNNGTNTTLFSLHMPDGWTNQTTVDGAPPATDAHGQPLISTLEETVGGVGGGLRTEPQKDVRARRHSSGV